MNENMPDNKTIDQAYNELLKVADSISDKTDDAESIKKAKDLLDNNIAPEVKDLITNLDTLNESDNKVIDDNSVEETKLDSETINTTYNPTTGDIIPTEHTNVNTAFEKTWNAFVGEDINKNSLDEISKAISTTDMQNINDYTMLMSLMVKRMNNEVIPNLYESLPNEMKSTVDKIYANLDHSQVKKNYRVSKNSIAMMLLDEFVEEYKKSSETNFDLDTMLDGFNSEISKETDNMAKELGSMMLSFDDERKAEIDAAIQRCETEGKLDSIPKLNLIKEALEKSFELTEFIEFCTKCRVRPFDFEKRAKIFREFNYPYQTHKNVINDITSCPEILNRHLPDYTPTDKMMLCLAFCHYCKRCNFSPDNISDHTFMYYFIRNIIVMDRLNPKGRLYETMDERSKEFYDSMSSRLSKCIDNLRVRNPDIHDLI